jgi:hypothetical protein
MKFDDPNRAICKDPKITGIFRSDFPAFIKSSLEYQLEKYCEYDMPPGAILAEKMFANLDFAFVSILNR